MAKAREDSSNETKDGEGTVEQFLTARLVKLTNRLSRQSIMLLKEVDSLRLPEWRCMAMIASRSAPDGKLNLRKIAEITEMDPGAISRAVQNLVEKGYVDSERDVVDRRNVYASLTPEGAAVYEKTLPVMQRRQASLVDALTVEECETVYRVIDRLLDVVEGWERAREDRS